MKHSVRHDLELGQAKKVTGHALDAYKTRFAEYKPTIEWKSDQQAEVRFAAKGMTIKGTFQLLPDRIDISMDVPFLLKMFQQKAVDVVEREIREWIERAKRGELDDEE